MAGKRFALKYTPNWQWLQLEPINGYAEFVFDRQDTSCLLQFLDLFIKKSDNQNGYSAKDIVTADRDLLLASIYIEYFGEKIESTLNCKNCNEKYDIDFSLQTILDQMTNTINAIEADGVYKIENGIQFRLPTGQDELDVFGLNPEKATQYIFEKCLIKGNLRTDFEKVQLQMQELAPMMSFPMQSKCPNCEQDQTISFDMQRFFTQKMMQEQKKLLAELHTMAMAYHWSKNEILEMPRTTRKQMISLIRNKG